MCGGANAGTPDSATGAGGPDPLELALIAAAGLLLVLLLIPMLWRQRLRRTRLRPQPRELSEQQVLAAWQELIDSAWDLGIPPGGGETPRRTAARLSELGDLGEEQRAAVGRVALATEQALYAPAATTPATLQQDVLLVRSGLLASASRRTRTRAVLLPPSGARLNERVRSALRAAAERALWGPLHRLRGLVAAGARRPRPGRRDGGTDG
ncbi:DUF4129 domain-containing protein [Streptacidiphilus sp. 4-A2]|nr:DUF4129 domain-containing protein [Streptacidiphilus sp. 4-A2]